MPRRARIVIPGLPLHVVQRGNNRIACFHDDDDRRFYLRHLARLARLCSCQVHAYCLMTNHVHVLLTPQGAESCGKLMRRLHLLHSQYMNRKYGRTGSLWEGRFRSCVVETETYLLQSYRYIELNPVRAGMVSMPADFAWSSFRSNGAGIDDPLISPHAEYLRLGSDRVERCARYLAMFEGALDVHAIRSATNGNFPLGRPAFLAELARALGRRVTPARAGRPPRSREPARDDPSASRGNRGASLI